MNRRERRVAARKPQTGLSRADASSPAALCEAGSRHLRAGRHLDAQLCCQQALEIDAGHADTLHLMGLLSFEAGQYDLAVEWMVRAIRQQPKPDYLSNLGSTLQRLGRHEEALKAFDKAAQLKPDDAELWKKIGNVLVDLERPAEALLSFQHVLKLDPRHWDAALRSGSLLHGLERFEEALRHFDICDELQPNHSLTLQARGLSLRGLKRFEEYLADSQRSHVLDPGNAETHNNIGDALKLLGRYEEALPWFDRALTLWPDFMPALLGKAFGLFQVHRFEEAVAIYRHVKKINPDHAEAEWNVALVSMLTGNFEDGWAGREARWNTTIRSAIYPNFSEPMWLGEESIEDKTVLVHVDEGLGDTIQFVRYMPMVAALGARVVLVVPNALYPLLSDFPGVSQCLPLSSGALPVFDFHCPICSLPLAFGTRLDTIPAAKSYLPPPADSMVKTWEDRLGRRDRLRIGLVWSGNPKHTNDHNRSLPLRALSRILDVDATFVSLQKDPRPDDEAVLLERADIVDLTAHLTDFVETSALVSCLDLLITVDTSVAHLAGALGCPTWILLPYTPDYRWLLDRDDSPWYPTVRLFRQDQTRDYVPVLDRVRTELLALVAAQNRKIDGGFAGAIAS
jgi:tetratricopeptide (TPR) repeat protein